MFVGRDRDIQYAVEMLTGSLGAGLVVSAVPGSGLSQFRDVVTAAVETQCEVIELRPLGIDGRTPFGTLYSLLDDTVDMSQALRLVGDHLSALGAQMPVVVVVPNAQFIDEDSSAVLAELAMRKVCRLLLTVDDPQGLPRGFLGLAQDGRIAELHLGPLTEHDTARVLREILGTDVPDPLTRRVVELSAGRARSLVGLARAVKRLSCEGQTPVNALGVMVERLGWSRTIGAELAGTLPVALNWLKDSERDLLDGLALAGGMRLGRVHRRFASADLDRLLALRLVRLTLDHRVEVDNVILSAALASAVLPGRRARLFDLAYPDEDLPSKGSALLGYALWRAADAEVPLLTGVRSARIAIDTGRPGAARVVLSAVPMTERDVVWWITALLADALTGHHSEIEPVVDPPVETENLLPWALTRSLDVMIDGHSGPICVAALGFDALDAQWQKRAGLTVKHLTAMRQMRDGCIADESSSDPDSEIAGELAWRVSEVQTLHSGTPFPPSAGDVGEAERLSRAVCGYLVGSPWEPTPTRGGFRPVDHMAFGLYLLGTSRYQAAGEAFACAEAIGTDVGSAWFAGRGRALAQFGLGRVEQALTLLSKSTPPPAGTRWLVARTGQILELAILALVDQPGAVAMLVEEGKQDLAEGRCLTAAHLLRYAALAGADVGSSLMDAASGLHHAVGRTDAMLASAIQSSDEAALVALAADLVRANRSHDAFLFARLARQRGDRGAPPEALRLVRGLRLGAEREQSGHVQLTPRELEIARLVADGLTNQRIASLLHLSVRTVEGHVSKVYAKLGVGREGLASAIR